MAKTTPTRRPDKQEEPTNAELAQLVLSMRAELAELKQQRQAPIDGRMAKGTAPQARQEPVTLEERIRAALVEQPQSVAELATSLGASPSTVESAITQLKRSKKVAETAKGRGLHRYVWKPESWTNTNPDVTKERRRILVGLLMEHPKGQSDLLEILDVSEEDAKQLEYDIIEIRRNEPVWWMNKGASGRGRSNIYWIRPDRLEPPPELDGRIARTSRKKSGDTKKT